ncbi:inositol monophosphatase family protein [Micromonospora zhanjiangensis]
MSQAQPVLSSVADLMLLVGEHIRRSLATQLHVRGSDGTVVTNVDLEADAMIRRGLEALTPAVTIFTEEASPRLTGSDSRWVVDPVDGTQNLVIGLPLVGSSVALMDKEGHCLLAVAADPVGGRVLAADSDTVYSQSWAGGGLKPLTPDELPRAEGVRRLALLRGNSSPALTPSSPGSTNSCRYG